MCTRRPRVGRKGKDRCDLIAGPAYCEIGRGGAGDIERALIYKEDGHTRTGAVGWGGDVGEEEGILDLPKNAGGTGHRWPSYGVAPAFEDRPLKDDDDNKNEGNDREDNDELQTLLLVAPGRQLSRTSLARVRSDATSAALHALSAAPSEYGDENLERGVTRPGSLRRALAARIEEERVWTESVRVARARGIDGRLPAVVESGIYLQMALAVESARTRVKMERRTKVGGVGDTYARTPTCALATPRSTLALILLARPCTNPHLSAAHPSPRRRAASLRPCACAVRHRSPALPPPVGGAARRASKTGRRKIGTTRRPTRRSESRGGSRSADGSRSASRSPAVRRARPRSRARDKREVGRGGGLGGEGGRAGGAVLPQSPPQLMSPALARQMCFTPIPSPVPDPVFTEPTSANLMSPRSPRAHGGPSTKMDRKRGDKDRDRVKNKGKDKDVPPLPLPDALRGRLRKKRSTPLAGGGGDVDGGGCGQWWRCRARRGA